MKIQTNQRACAAFSVALLIGTATAAAQAPVMRTIYSFGGTGYGEPTTRLVAGPDGGLYGTLAQGANANGGSVFVLNRASAGAPWTETVIYNITGPDEGNALPVALAAEGEVLYVATYQGGSSSDGSVFSLAPPSAGGSWTATNLYNFAGTGDGLYPSALIVHNGVVYGTTLYGGTSNQGVVFSLTPPATPGGAWTEAVLYNFTGFSDGGQPGSLVAGTDGVLYGTALSGGFATRGVAFSIMPPASPGGPWTEALLHSFNGGADGAYPRSSLTPGPGGVLYGTTDSGGSEPSQNCGFGCGTVFALIPPSSPEGSWNEVVLYAFGGGADGAFPDATVVLGSGEVLYGTTSGGGGATRCNAGCGTLFSLTPPAAAGGAWTESVLHAFSDRGPDGSLAETALTLSGSVIYGTTAAGGTYQSGTAFQLKP